MSDFSGTTVHEAYAFACMRCGHGWEQSYDIEHHVDAAGEPYVTYRADGEKVPSPLTRPTCLNCGGHVVRIMRAGQVSSVLALMGQRGAAAKGGASGTGPAAEDAGTAAAPAAAKPEHHWHLSDLLHPFHRK
ncbi:hypothetical protein [Streptomyces sp. NPDC050504]|uniref:hypothetical protein n=1 Tax=Streptomyces sp. NPDC050504 TaxID=3365618 RepID=UPI0037ACEB80